MDYDLCCWSGIGDWESDWDLESKGENMKYLQKSFSVFMGGFRDEAAKVVEKMNADKWYRKPPNPRRHTYQDCGGMCYECALDKIGHNNQQRKLKNQ